MPKHKYHAAFTLVELLVVIAIIGILVGMLLPAVQQVRESARRATCSNNMRNLSLGMHTFASTFGHFPSGFITKDPLIDARAAIGGKAFGWGAQILSFVEQDALYEKIRGTSNNFQNPWWSSGQVNYALVPLPIFICPSCPMDRILPGASRHGNYAKSNYVGVIGPKSSRNLGDITDLSQISNTQSGPVNSGAGNELEQLQLKYPGILYVNSKVKFRDIRDGTSNTLLIGERDGAFMGTDGGGNSRVRAAATWCGSQTPKFLDYCLGPTSGDPRWTINSSVLGFKEQYVPFASSHPSGCNFARADGSLQFVPDEIDGALYEAMGAKDDGR